MVDLVKIRKKAKDRREARAESHAQVPVGDQAREPVAASAPPTANPVVEPAAPAPGPPAAASQPVPVPLATEPATIPAPADEPTVASTTKLEKFKREAGKRREADAAAQAAATGRELLELLTFNIAGEQYAVAIEHIVEIVVPRPATRVPNADPSVVGIVSLRGTVVTLVDVRRKLRHHSSTGNGPDARVVVVEYGGETLGFLVDRVLRVVKVDPATIEPHPVVHASEYDDSVRGVFRIADALTILLDLDKLLESRLSVAIA